MRVCDAAMAVVTESKSPSLMWGDLNLCHAIADRLGWQHDGWRTPKRVLHALSRTPGMFTKRRILIEGHWVLYFTPNAPAEARSSLQPVVGTLDRKETD
jgi:hypothetical protein